MQEEKKSLIEDQSGSSSVDNKSTKTEKKLVEVKGPDNFGMFRLGYQGGGEMPDAFKMAKWTSRMEADIAVEKYNRNR